jgi:hypothetical protein
MCAARLPTPTRVAELPALLSGVLARLGRRTAAGLVLCSAMSDRAVMRGVLDGCAARLLLIAPARSESAPPESAHVEVEHLLRTYYGRICSRLERASLAREITTLALRNGLVTPWTALLAEPSPQPPCRSARPVA